MPYILVYHPHISRDIARLPKNIKNRVRRALEERLSVDPLRFGAPLRRSLRGYRKLRVGDYRVLYRIERESVIILKIGHRKEVYGEFSP